MRGGIEFGLRCAPSFVQVLDSAWGWVPSAIQTILKNFLLTSSYHLSQLAMLIFQFFHVELLGALALRQIKQFVFFTAVLTLLILLFLDRAHHLHQLFLSCLSFFGLLSKLDTEILPCNFPSLLIFFLFLLLLFQCLFFFGLSALMLFDLGCIRHLVPHFPYNLHEILIFDLP